MIRLVICCLCVPVAMSLVFNFAVGALERAARKAGV